MRKLTHGFPAGLVALLLGSTDAGAASQTATYDVRFDATWSATTHPISFPPNAHWSPLIGGTHDASVLFWQAGSLASAGIKRMAEIGATSPLDLEVEAAITAGQAGTVIQGSGINPSPGTTTTSFTIALDFPLVTLVSMIAPSPDWFVGVSAFSLLSNGEWVDSTEVQLLAYDAGTDCGVAYTSANCVSTPPEPIALNPAPPFVGGTALGSFVFIRTDTPTDVGRNPEAHPEVLGQSYPNPARSALTLHYSLSRPGHARLIIYDVAGRHVRTLQDGPAGAGTHAVSWDRRTQGGSRAPAGIYVYELRSSEGRSAKRLTLLP